MGMGSELSAHQKLLLEMLKDFDAVCRRHGIRYQLFAGSALGAVRHNGFIPWDDDLDVILSRSEYERFFREAAMDFDPEIYYVQQEHSPHWSMHFSKLRRNGTTCIEKYHPKDPGIHQGVYIDIFPYDNLASSPFQRAAAIRRIQSDHRQGALGAGGTKPTTLQKKLFFAGLPACFRAVRWKESACAGMIPSRGWYTLFSLPEKGIRKIFSPVHGWTIVQSCLLRTECFRFLRIMTRC